MKKFKTTRRLPTHKRMGLWSNTPSGGLWLKSLARAVWVTGAVLGIVVVVPGARGQVQSAEAEIDAPLLDTSHAQRAFLMVEDWLGKDEEARQEARPIRVTGLIGVRLVLRTGGVVVGEGEAYREDVQGVLDVPGPSIDLVPLLMSATGQAEAGIRESMADAQQRAVLAGRAVQDSEKLTLTDVSSNLDVDLELAYGLHRVSIPAGAGADEVYARFAPCYHGLGFVNAKKGKWSWVWPGVAASRNIAPPSQLVLGLKGLGKRRSAIKRLGRPGGIGLARFKTIHVVRPFTGAQPTFLVRSSIDLPRYAVGERELAGMGDRLIEHLFNRFTSEGQIRGTYHPTSGRYDPLVASDDQAALACYAMVHHSRYLATIRPEDQSLAAYTRRAGQVASGLGDRMLAAGDKADPRVAALVLLTLLEAPATETDQAMRDRLGDLLLAVTADGAADGGIGNSGAEALSAAALATLYERTRDDRLGQALWELTDRFWSRGDGVPNLSALPWLALADERAGDLLADVDTLGARRAELDRRRAILSVLIQRLCQHQVIEKPALGPDDVLGGFVLTPGPAGSPPNPDWRNAQPLMFLSILLRDEKVTQGQDKLGWLLSAGYSARFVGQLMMDETSSYYVRDRVAARGGVRMAPWDNRLALAPSAMGLLALTELQTTLATFKPAPVLPESRPSLIDADTTDHVPGEASVPAGQP